MTPLVDGHLDLAYNAVRFGRDLTRPVRDTRALEAGADAAMVSLPDLQRGGVALAFATLFARPADPAQATAGYTTPAEAEAQALEQLAVYERWATDDRVRIVLDRAGLEAHLERWREDRTLGLVLLMEGADPILRPADLDAWWARGIRIVGPSWRATRYAGGTRAPGGLTPEGRELVARIQDRGAILDASHMAEDAFWQALDLGATRVIASHSNARGLVPTDRHLSDEMIRAIGDRNGVVGLLLGNAFLEPRWSREDRSVPVTLADQVRRHAERVAALVGWDRVAIGSDLDGGFGRDESPLELDTVADLHRVGEVVPPAARDGVLGANWLRLLRAALP